MFQKIINLLAVLAFLMSGAASVGVGYVIVNQEVIQKQIQIRIVEIIAENLSGQIGQAILSGPAEELEEASESATDQIKEAVGGFLPF